MTEIEAETNFGEPNIDHDTDLAEEETIDGTDDDDNCSPMEIDASTTSQSESLVVIKPSTHTKLIQFARSCVIDLLLPFINGLMLGFGELVAHEVAWRYNWFDRRNVKAFKIEPESRKYAGLDSRREDRRRESLRDGVTTRRLDVL